MMLRVLLVLAIALAANAAPIAPCFNDSGPKDGQLGFWAYEGHQDWRSARAALRASKTLDGTFVFSFAPGKAEQDVSDLRYCFYMPPGSPDSKNVKCRAGTLHLTKVDVPRVVEGRYDFELANGERKALEFSAPYCPPERQ